MHSFIRSNRLNFDKICIFYKHVRSSFGAERKFFKKKITEANFSNLVSYLLYAYQKESTDKLLAKSILWAKLDMRILQRLALKENQTFPILFLERQNIHLSKTGCNLSWILFKKKKSLKCLKNTFAYTSYYPTFKVKFEDFFSRHVPWLQIPSNVARVNILW